MYLKRFVLVVLFMFALGACGDDSGGTAGNTGNTTPTTPTVPPTSVKLAGIVTYTHYKAGPSGLEYNTPIEKPIRGAVIELRDASGTILASGNTTETGAYSFTVPLNASLNVLVKAVLGLPDATHLTVVNNTSQNALYALKLDVTTETSDITQNFNANSGWDGTSYSGVRAAASFAILDTIYQAEKLILSADSTVVFPELTVNWSKNNKPTAGSNSLGNIGTTHYEADNLYVLGAENIDTDEYDASPVLFAWSHYFQSKISRSDSTEGRHKAGDILNPTLAFSDGFANAFSGMVLNDPVLRDIGGVSQGTVFINHNLETDSVPDTDVVTNGTALAKGTLLDGYYSMFSVIEVLYDLFDSGASDDDALSLGFKPIYDVMVGGHKNTPAFTSIFSFLHHLKAANSSVSAQITALAAAENIGVGNEFEVSSAPFYTLVPTDGSIVSLDVNGKALQTLDTYGPIPPFSLFFFPGNKLFNVIALKFSIPGDGKYTIEVTPTGGGHLFFALNEKGRITSAFGRLPGQKAVFVKSLIAGTHSMGVGSFGAPAAFTVRIVQTPA